MGYFLLLLIPLTIAGFYKTYIGLFPDFGERIDLYIHLHAFIVSLWIAIMIIQSILIANKKWALHRRIGKLSYILFPLLILSFVPQIIKMVSRVDFADLFFPVSDSILLIVLYSLTIYDLSSKRIDHPYLIVMIFFVIHQSVFYWVFL